MRRAAIASITSHAGSLPRPDDLIEANASARRQGRRGALPEAADAQSVADVVRRQVAAGIAVPGDGEYGKSMGHKVNYRAWWSYSFRGWRPRGEGLGLYDMPVHRSSPGNTVLSSFADRRDRRASPPPTRSRVRRLDRAACARLAVLRRAVELHRP
jgi:5-methyltetrahydropteroyltriglutamate--homocysteine methyltransferase